MSWGRKRMYLALAVMLALLPVAAEDSVFIGDGDIASIRMFDSQGVALDATVEVASNIGEGWIIYNPDSPILIITPKGSISLYEESILITGDLIGNNPSLYLVQGKATFNTYDMRGGTLSVSTPVSLFKLTGDGEMFVITDDIEESVTVFKGEVTSFNSITRSTRSIEAFHKLSMQGSLAKAKPIATGYYLTYATYPDLMLAKQLLNEMAKADTPSIPKFSSVLQKPQKVEKPMLAQGVTIMPAKAPTFASVEVNETPVPSRPYTISVTSEPVKVPSIPRTLSFSSIPKPKNRIVVTVKPMDPVPPTLEVSVTETTVPDSSEVPKPIVTEVSAPKDLPVLEPTETDKTAIPEETPAKEKPQSILFTQEKELKTGSIGVETSYDFLIDGTDNNSLTHSLSLKPYVTYKSFALTLQSSVSTKDFSLYTSNTTPLPTGTLESISYGFKYISALRFGYTSSPFFLALGNNQYHSTLSDQYFAPRFGESEKLSLFNRIEMGPISTNLYFDDLYLTNFLSTPGKHQFGSFSLEYARKEGYRFSASLGALARVEKKPSAWDVVLYPNLNFLFPLIDIRTTQLSLLVSASGYLPVYPDFEGSEFIDTALTSLFPNYQVSTGFSLKQGAFSAKLLGSFRKGENRNLMTSDLAYASDTSYDSVFDIFAETGFAGDHFNAHLTVNLPIANDATIATAPAGHKADFSQLTLSYKQKSFTFSLGLQEVGISETISSILDGSQALTTLFGGSRATSFLSAAYTLKGLTVRAKASYPADVNVYTTPKITFTASYKFGFTY